jgi:DNA replication protein DnaC
VRCSCQYGNDQANRQRHLLTIDGLNPFERQFRFTNMQRTKSNAKAVEAVTKALMSRRGIVTLTGEPGRGKTHLLCCAVNEAREASLPAVYTTTSDVLNYLRNAYDPNREDKTDFDRRWDLLVKVDVLALDELDDFNATPWAMEYFLRLMDERWRSINSKITLLATNTAVDNLAPKVASRLKDGRAMVVKVEGKDIRPYLKDQP